MVRGVNDLVSAAAYMPLLFDSFCQKRFAACSCKRHFVILAKELQVCKSVVCLSGNAGLLSICNYWLDLTQNRIVVNASFKRALAMVRKCGKTNSQLARRAGLRLYK